MAIFGGLGWQPTLDLLAHSVRGPLRQRIVFLHVPKCGGTAVDAAIRRAYGLQGRARHALHTIAPDSSRTVATFAGVPTALMRKYLAAHAVARGAWYVSGHLHFDGAFDAHFGHELAYVTVLREPVGKWFSQYFYNRYKRRDHGRVTLDLADFLSTPEALLYGQDYAYFLGPGRPELGESVDPAAAIANFGRIAVIGLLEDLPRFRRDFRARFGVDLRILHTNRTPAPVAARDQAEDPAIRAEVERLCATNLRIYAAARERLAAGSRAAR